MDACGLLWTDVLAVDNPHIGSRGAFLDDGDRLALHHCDRRGAETRRGQVFAFPKWERKSRHLLLMIGDLPALPIFLEDSA